MHMGFFQTVVGLYDVIIDDVLFLGEDKQLNKILGITGEGSGEHLTYAIRCLAECLGILQRPRFVAQGMKVMLKLDAPTAVRHLGVFGDDLAACVKDLNLVGVYTHSNGAEGESVRYGVVRPVYGYRSIVGDLTLDHLEAGYVVRPGSHGVKVLLGERDNVCRCRAVALCIEFGTSGT